MVDAPTPPVRPLLPEGFALLAAHRPAFGQERPYQRSLALVVGGPCALGRHTSTGVLLGLGLGESDGTAWHRRFRRGRVDDARLPGCLLEQTLALVPATAP